MEWIVLAGAGALYLLAAYITFQEEWRNSGTGLLAYACIAIATSIAWLLTARYIGDKNRIYFYSLCWDTMLVLVFYLTPILLFGVKLDRWGVAGITLMIAGLCLLKFNQS